VEAQAGATLNSHRYGASTRGETLREKILRDLASRAATDLAFVRQARQDLQGTLTRHGYHLTDEERSLVEGLRRQTASMTDKEVARVLASGLRGRTGTPPVRPAAPSWRGSGPGRPTRRLKLVGCVTSTGHARSSRRWSIPTGMEGSR
jgi:hypothetical protein